MVGVTDDGAADSVAAHFVCSVERSEQINFAASPSLSEAAAVLHPLSLHSS